MKKKALLHLLVIVALVLSLAPLAAPAQVVLAISPDVVISQVYGGGGNSSAPYTNDYIELFNRGTATVSLAGWSVQYASATGTGNFGSATNLITPLSGSLAPGQYLLIQEAAGTTPSAALPTPDVTDSTPINMAAGGGKVAVVNTTTPLGCNGGSTPCSPAALATVVDLVGWDGANFFEGSGPGPTTSNTTAALRAAGGCTDTDNNTADFALGAPNPRNTVSPFNSCSTPVINLTINDVSLNEGNSGTTTFAFNVSLSSPAGAGGVTFDIATQDGTATIADNDYVAHSLTGQTIPSGSSSYTFNVLVNGDATVEPDETFLANVTNIVGATVVDGQGQGTIQNDEVVITPVHAIQDTSHLSPFAGQVVTTRGIVTARRSNGFYLQDPNPDANAATSEGIFVFTSSSPTVSVGDEVQVSGTVSEFRAGGSSSTNLTLTELTSPVISVLSTGNALPAPIVIGSGGRVPPAMVIEDDASGSVETSGVFDPANDGIDFYESLEGMLVQVNDAVATSPTRDFGSNREISVVGDNGANAGVLTPRGGIIVRSNDFNPERIILNDLIAGGPILPAVNVGAAFPGAIIGVIDYNFGNFKLEVISTPSATGSLAQESTSAAGMNQLSVATFNVENLDPADPPSKFSELAELIVDNLKSPDILAVEEIQDNNGATNDSVVDATTTFSLLIAAIDTACGSGCPYSYDFRQINPVDDQDGGEPGGNIRVGFLFRTDRGLSFIDRPGAGSTTANAVIGSGASTQLLYSPGRINPTSSAFTTSRKPLAGEFMFNGHHVFVIANHFNSKGGDDPLYGRFQPPTLSSEVQRLQQATAVNGFVNAITSADPAANVVVLGDLNDFEFSNPLNILKGTLLNDLIETLPQGERYTYVFDGNSQALDHILVSDELFNRPYAYDVVHVNAEFAVQASDHDPQVVRITLNDPPTVDAGGPYSVIEGSSVVVSALGSDLENDLKGEPLSYAWDLDNNGTFETPGQSATFSAPAGSAPSINTIKVQVTDDGGLTAVDTATVNIIYNFTGFFQPVDNLPTLNSVIAGRAIPVKFSLGGDKGLNIFAAGYPKSEQIGCNSNALVDGIEETVTAGNSSLSYDASFDRYSYVWKTEKSWAGQCRQLVVKFIDGTSQRANFTFK